MEKRSQVHENWVGEEKKNFVCLFVCLLVCLLWPWQFFFYNVTQAMNITSDTLEKLNPEVQESKAPLLNCKNTSVDLLIC